MREYHVNFKKVTVGARDEIYAEVSETDPPLIAAVDQIRTRIEAAAATAGFDLRTIPNGHFMEIEFLLDDDAVHGVVFLTPYLPETFVDLVRGVLRDAGIDGVF